MHAPMNIYTYPRGARKFITIWYSFLARVTTAWPHIRAHRQIVVLIFTRWSEKLISDGKVLWAQYSHLPSALGIIKN